MITDADVLTEQTTLRIATQKKKKADNVSHHTDQSLSPIATNFKVLLKNLAMTIANIQDQTREEDVAFILDLLDRFKSSQETALLQNFRQDNGTLIHLAAGKNLPEVIEVLKTLGVDPTIKAVGTITALHWAAAAGATESMEALWDLNTNIGTDTPFQFAIKYTKSLDAIRFFVENKKLNPFAYPPDAPELSPFSVAASESKLEIVQYFLNWHKENFNENNQWILNNVVEAMKGVIDDAHDNADEDEECEFYKQILPLLTVKFGPKEIPNAATEAGLRFSQTDDDSRSGNSSVKRRKINTEIYL